MSVFVRIEGLNPEDLSDDAAHDLADRLFADIREDYPNLYSDLSSVIPVLDETEHARLVAAATIERPTEQDEAIDQTTWSAGPVERDDYEHLGDASDLDRDEWDWIDACGHAYRRVEDDEVETTTDARQEADS